MGSLVGKTALVTGASRGIGRGIARELARQGALVAVHYGANEQAARETVELIDRDGGRAFAVRAELGAPDDVETLYSQVETGLAEQGQGPELDILVNNAAVSGSARIHEVTPELFDRLFAVNTRSLLFLVQRGLKNLRDGGRIINVSSAATRIAYPESVVYSMTKGALNTFTLALAKELGPRGITVNAVGPGFVATDMNADRRATEEAAARLAGWSVFNRLGQPSDIAEIVGFLASDASRWITGQCLDASGGSGL
ncbi:3-oxoacyl-[acyl-carrier protein] reductase [Streptomyces sp. TLI_55]|uniref:SDR family oxidoreductase n=1 Tax=Streptomyces sp. TLI_55 TaxID=1938861 RepID=UPI000BD7D5BC|nr:SDR family oxidoreductase [Streptomyces sp. TLI_55]SNX88259.1 3-oxoacyl-[acyl-carrier protein] reductase [Streptomyces sp. TLI_55]